MANIKNTKEWVDNVRQIEVGDRVIGGTDAPINICLSHLVGRTGYLKDKIDAVPTDRVAGLLKISSVTNSADEDTAASLKAVKTAYDKAVAAGKGHTHTAAEITDFASAVAALTVHQKIGTFDICKLPDGTQIESGTVRIQNHNNNPTARVLTWPLAFITAPVVVATLSAPEGNVRDIWVTIDSRQSNQSAVYYWLHEQIYNTPDVTVNFVAIGRWK